MSKGNGVSPTTGAPLTGTAESTPRVVWPIVPMWPPVAQWQLPGPMPKRRAPIGACVSMRPVNVDVTQVGLLWTFNFLAS